VIQYVEPVPDVLTLAIDRDGFLSDALQNHDRDQFFWELIRAVVVRAVGD
jgi:hypothetical protein